MNKFLIGTGFYADDTNHFERQELFSLWLENIKITCPLPVVVDNSLFGLSDPARARVVEIFNNLGHMSQAAALRSQLAGWSMSWIIPAWIAYSEECDFVYKEQDCFAFGDWLTELIVPGARMTFGSNDQMDCEQSLFWIQRDFIPEVISAYCAIPFQDATYVCERKFADLEKKLPGIARFSMGVGRNRPLPTDLLAQPWYAQKIQPQEWKTIRAAGLV